MVWPEVANSYNEPMTVCIAAKSDNSESLILAADQMATMPHLAAENEGSHKILEVADNIYLLSAGNEFNARKIYDKAIANKANIKTVEDALQAVYRGYHEVKLSEAEDTFLRPRGFAGIQDYLTRHNSLNNNVVALVDQNLMNQKFFRETYILAGINPDGEAKIYLIQPPGKYGEVSDFIAIGSGQSHASNSLYARGYDVKQQSEESVYLVFEAKKRSEIAPGVGVKTDMLLLKHKQKTKMYTEKELTELNELYKGIVESEKELLAKNIGSKKAQK